MRLPAISGIIDRRILANFRIDPAYVAKVLPPPFRPHLYGGWAIGGICLIRLKQVRPKFLPIPVGLGSENAAHRIAVEWDANGETKQGVYIPRRDTSSRLNSWAGGRIFPGVHHHARFQVAEHGHRYSITMQSDDGTASVHVSGTVVEEIPADSIFGSIQSASQFFERGALGYSATAVDGRFDGLELKCHRWQIEALQTDSIQSSYFENIDQFPTGSVIFDCALLMRNINHEWHSHQDLCCSVAKAAGDNN